MPARSANRSAVASSADDKVSVNVGCIDLGQIDLLVQEGFYANRTDLIRTAIRNQLAKHEAVLQRTVERKMLALGIHHLTVADLDAAKAAGQRLQIRVLGLATIASDVTPQLALETIESITVLGVLNASPGVRAALASRLRAA